MEERERLQEIKNYKSCLWFQHDCHCPDRSIVCNNSTRKCVCIKNYSSLQQQKQIYEYIPMKTITMKKKKSVCKCIIL